MELLQRERAIPTPNDAVLEAALFDGHAGKLAGQFEQVVAQGLGGSLDAECRDAGASAGEGAGVVGVFIGIDEIHGD